MTLGVCLEEALLFLRCYTKHECFTQLSGCPLILLSEHAIYCLQIYLQNDELWNNRSLISDKPVTWALLCTGGGDEHQSSGGRYWAKQSISITIVTNKQTWCLWRIVYCYCTEGRKRWGKKYGSIQDWLPHYGCVIINDIIWMEPVTPQNSVAWNAPWPWPRALGYHCR